MTEERTRKNTSMEISYRQLSGLGEISEESATKLKLQSSLLRFKIGQLLADGSTLPKQTYWIIEGVCRLLGQEKGKAVTQGRIGPGSSIGIASLLRAEPCEKITASTEVVALAVPDELILELYKSEKSFKNWCEKTVWPAEILAILERIDQSDAVISKSLEERFKYAFNNAQLFSSIEETKGISKNAINSQLEFYIASANTDIKIGTRLDPDHAWPQARPPFNLRVIAFPIDVQEPKEIEGKNPENATTTQKQIEDSLPYLEKSGLDVGQYNELSTFKLIRGEGKLGETLACFQMLTGQLKLPFRKDSIEKVLRDSLRRGQNPSVQICGQIGASLGLHVTSGKVPAEAGLRIRVPSMVAWKDSFAIAIRSDNNGLMLASPKEGEILITNQQLKDEFPEGINVLLMERAVNTPEQRFGLEWFMPALSKYKGVLTQVLIASAVVQLFGLANPLLIQVIIDKVISQRSLDTLQVLGIGLVIVTVLEGVLGSLRTFLFTQTTNRIDQRLGAEVIDHLLRLPLGYFDRRPVGELGTRIAELEKIRNFLTGTALTTVLDAAFSLIYIVVMSFYSWLLTLVALAVLPIQIGLTLLGAPLFRRQFRQAAEQNAKTQSHLVEVLTGIQTVKAQNIEMVSRWKWQEYYSQYISKTFEQTVTGTALNQTSQVLQKLSQLLVLWVGAALVLKGQLTLGQLIAFRIISGYVTQPLLRLSSIWQSVQELKVSFERLADVIDTPIESRESDQSKIPLPPIDGSVKFEDIAFSFKAGQAPILRNINLDIQAGTFVGIVGQSGSGKSTLMKLLPRLYSPEHGRIKIDGYDIDKVELYSLRRQIGIVPQDPLLFTGTIADNISQTNPDASSEEIVQAAKLACAHDFIMDLPNGYSTPVGERGGSLSGGQRQRIAIARTLLNNPKMLVMDEATSALDYETERRVCENLLENLNDCTVFFITHRLSTIKRANRVIMMDRGAIVEEGTHNSLMEMGGRYYALYRQQEAN